ncbi:hypothetical protein GE061_019464 [Apolygus lucorum]|uniref:Uncharacterized protein n=1 Tax=Apolygus lucorum TaxID=248454 RepID=A0A6A4JR59_APOLU|nr:hypothetical protein GE061_019464 [Apolygus lucorum]
MDLNDGDDRKIFTDSTNEEDVERYMSWSQGSSRRAAEIICAPLRQLEVQPAKPPLGPELITAVNMVFESHQRGLVELVESLFGSLTASFGHVALKKTYGSRPATDLPNAYQLV